MADLLRETIVLLVLRAMAMSDEGKHREWSVEESANY